MINKTKLMHNIQAHLKTCLPPTAEQLEKCVHCLKTMLQTLSLEYQLKSVCHDIAALENKLLTAKRNRCNAERLNIHKQIYEAAKKNFTN